jgi:hypothetical protein
MLSYSKTKFPPNIRSKLTPVNRSPPCSICCCSSSSSNNESSSKARLSRTTALPTLPVGTFNSNAAQQAGRQQRNRHGAKPQSRQGTEARPPPAAAGAAAAAELDAPGMPLLLGLKQLPAGAQSLLGWQVLLCGSNEAVGTVVQVCVRLTL